MGARIDGVLIADDGHENLAIEAAKHLKNDDHEMEHDDNLKKLARGIE